VRCEWAPITRGVAPRSALVGRLLLSLTHLTGVVENEPHDRLFGHERMFHVSQSFFTLRQVRLIVFLPTAPPKRAASARRTWRVLVPAR
jgi:hypothetical protein